jgi:F0F1-type ATP synthase delta subunit
MDKAYAQALLEVIEGGITPKKTVKNLHEALAARGRLGLLPKVARAFNLLAAQKEAENAIVLKVARASDAKRAVKEAAAILKDAGVKSADVKIDVREYLIGGWRLEGKERLHDASHKAQLLDIYEKVSS